MAEFDQPCRLAQLQNLQEQRTSAFKCRLRKSLFNSKSEDLRPFNRFGMSLSEFARDSPGISGIRTLLHARNVNGEPPKPVYKACAESLESKESRT